MLLPCPGQPSTETALYRVHSPYRNLRRRQLFAPRLRGHWGRRNVNAYSLFCMKNGFRIGPRRPSRPLCWMKGTTYARPERCIEFWKKKEKRANAATRPFIRSIRNRSCWPPRPIHCGAGTSPNCVVRSNGIEESIQKHEIPIAPLTIHADRGKVMRSKHVAFLLDDLGVSKTHSRPYVSNDNPYSESQFRTLKYRPGFPDRFGCIQVVRNSSPGTTTNIAIPESRY